MHCKLSTATANGISPHRMKMHREHYISFVAFLTGDTMIVKKQYPVGN